jgi:hypothetical protein
MMMIITANIPIKMKTDIQSPSEFIRWSGIEQNFSINIETFPYLDMQMFWTENEELNFKVHLKPNQELKYLNRGSNHTKATFKAIPHGVLSRLAKLTTMTEENKNTRMNALYPEHAAALEKAKLAPKKWPSLKQMMKKVHKSDEEKKQKKKDREKRQKKILRDCFFCLGVSSIWKKPVHKIIKEIRDRHGLKGIRISMSYHRFPNFREKLKNDLTTKIMRGVFDKDHKNDNCNCTAPSLLEGACIYGGKCRQSTIIYSLKCKICDMIYVGKSQQHFKQRTQQHMGEAWKHARAMKKKHGHENWEDVGGSCGSDAFAKHFGSHVRHASNSNEARTIIKSILDPTILWQGERIKCMKSATTLKCTLCMQERKELMKRFRIDRGKMINDNSEIYGPCMCKTNFHRLARDLET